MVFQVNVPVGEAKEGETAPRRNYKVKDGAVSRPKGYECTTVYEFFNEALKKHGANNRIQAWRDLVDVHYETKQLKKVVNGEETLVDKEWTYYELSDYKYITQGELSEIVSDLGKGLVKIGLEPAKTDKLHLFAATSAKWMRGFLAAQTQAIPVVTAYDTLGEDGLTHSILETESNAIYTDNDLLIKLVNPLKKATSIRYIIHTEPIDPKDKRGNGRLYQNAKNAVAKILEVRPDIKIYSYDEVLKLGKEAQDIPHHPPKQDDLCCIMYTSGSTGNPKGVVLSHANVVAGLGGVSVSIDDKTVRSDDVLITFLPLAHIFELAFELVSFYWGSTSGYANVKTLTNASTRNCDGDIKTLKPTIMVGVTAIWETVKKGIYAQIQKQPSAMQKVFWGAYHAKLACKKYSIPGVPALLDTLVFKKIKEATGGRLRLLLNGGSQLSLPTQIFIHTTIATMLLGYGLTETVANTTITDPEHFEFGGAALVGSITVKLIDVPEAGYYAKNNQGEVLISGAPVTSGYFKNDKETQEAFAYEKGWFSTGDIGEWTSSGQLKLIDRKKNLVKTQNGEYIALEKLEAVYRSNALVNNICCYADENKVKPIAIVNPNEKPLKDLSVKLGISKAGEEIHLSDIITNTKLAREVAKSLVETGKAQNLAGIELIQAAVLVDEEWTPESGFVTSAQKLKRKAILESVKSRVDEAYASS
ncbi:hypothetical protein OGAPHI_002549 [Ogataea philodendri]|uniref:AMP-dependent synthetase/ligase domain-containing protein n=1 Tax=Ogataea philodendri TaxID=1378263 RepID=A0A9P8T7T5_9ASCO|nr:uncharacterized protein OGAPHI_002549 [Ogataea philodendri]KAH3668794.1 hypothetical protein OGAPHI_002549 [Ogataea philodendri]